MARRSAKQQHNPHRRQNLHYPQSMPFSLASLSLSHSIVLSRFSQNLLINEIPKILPSSSSSNQILAQYVFTFQTGLGKQSRKQTNYRKFTKPSQTNKRKTKAKGRRKDHLHRTKKLHKLHHKKFTVTLEPNKRLKAPCDGRETQISFFLLLLRRRRRRRLRQNNDRVLFVCVNCKCELKLFWTTTRLPPIFFF